MGGLDSPGFARFKQLFKEGFEAARKHSDSILSTHELAPNTCLTALIEFFDLFTAIVELMQKGKLHAGPDYLHR